MDIYIEQATKQEELSTDSIKKLERRWFWITLFSFLGMYYANTSLTDFIGYALLLDSVPLYGAQYVACSVGMLLVPLLLDRCGALETPKKFARTFYVLTVLGILNMAIFSYWMGTLSNPNHGPLEIGMSLLCVLLPAAVAGVALRRAVKVCAREKAALLCGFMYTLVVILQGAHYFSNYTLDIYYLSVSLQYNCVYVLLLIVPAILLLGAKDDWRYVAPPDPTPIPKRISQGFFLFAILVLQVMVFDNIAFYADGNYDNFSGAFLCGMFVIMAASIFVSTLILMKGKWLFLFALCLLLSILHSGMILFLDGIPVLAQAYVITGALASGTNIFLLLISLVYCLRLRNTGLAVALMLTLDNLEMAALEFSGIRETLNETSTILTPAFSFSISLIAVGFLFYLYHQYTRNETRVLLASIREGWTQQKSLRETLDEMSLTPRERELAGLLLTEVAQKNIASRMGVSYSTVKFHSNNLYRKLNIQSRAELFSLFAMPVPEAVGETDSAKKE